MDPCSFLVLTLPLWGCLSHLNDCLNYLVFHSLECKWGCVVVQSICPHTLLLTMVNTNISINISFHINFSVNIHISTLVPVPFSPSFRQYLVAFIQRLLDLGIDFEVPISRTALANTSCVSCVGRLVHLVPSISNTH